jgi:hypothetical protein
MQAMIFRKVISLMLSTTMLSMLFLSCGVDTISQPNELKSDENVQIKAAEKLNNELPRRNQNPLIVEPGRIHNAILAEMNRNGIFTRGDKVSEDEYIAIIVESCNSVFRSRNIGQEVTEDDIRAVLQCFDSWRERGVFDVYSPIEDRRTGDVYYLLDHMAAAGEVCGREELEEIRMAFEELESIGISNCSRETVRRIADNHKSDDCSSASYRALTILEDSYEFWSTLKDETAAIDTLRLIGDESQYDSKLTIDWYSISILLWDSVGALLCWPFGPFSVLCALVASSAFILATSRE